MDREVTNLGCNDNLKLLIGQYKKLQDEIIAQKDKDKIRVTLDEKLVEARDAFSVAKSHLAFLTKNNGTENEIENALKALAEAEELFKAAETTRLSAGNSETSKLLSRFSENKDKLTFVVKGNFYPENTKNIDTIYFRPSKEVISKIYNKATYDAISSKCDKFSEQNDFCKAWPSLQVAIVPLSNSAKGSQAKPVEANQISGIYYRQPGTARLIACSPYCNVSDFTTNSNSDRVLYQELVSIPQIGQLSVLTLKNKIFDDNSISATFNDDGSVATLEFNSLSRAEAASASAATAGEKYRNFVTDIITDARTEKEHLLKAIQTEADIKKETSQSDVDYLDSRINLLKKYQELESVRAGTASKAQMEINSLENYKRKLGLLKEIAKLKNELKLENIKE